MAYCIPYPLSRLTRLIDEVGENEFVEVSTLGKSIGHIRIPLISITDGNEILKKLVIITARVHPG